MQNILVWLLFFTTPIYFGVMARNNYLLVCVPKYSVVKDTDWNKRLAAYNTVETFAQNFPDMSSDYW